MRKWLVSLMILSLLAGACSSAPNPQEDPLGALVAAIEETGKADAQTITLTLQSTPESLVAASEGGVTPAVAEAILGSSVTFSGTQSDDPEDQSGRIAVSVPGTEGFEMLILGTDVYLRADVRGFASVGGVDPARIDEFLQSPQAQQAPFLQSAADGEFIRIEGADQLAGATGLGGGGQQLTEQQEELLRAFGDAIEQSATVTSEGTDDVGDHLVASIPLRDLYQKSVDIIGRLGLPMAPGQIPPETEIPEGDVLMDVWIADGRVVQFEFDFVRLALEFGEEIPEGVEQMALRVQLDDEVAEITAPEDAVTVSSEQLMGLIFGGLGGFGGEESVEVPREVVSPGEVPAFDCSMYEGLPPETFQGLPPEALAELERTCPDVIPD
jgi:hypothetical protein